MDNNDFLILDDYNSFDSFGDFSQNDFYVFHSASFYDSLPVLIAK